MSSYSDGFWLLCRGRFADECRLRGGERPVVERMRRSGGKNDSGGLRRVEEEDEDDEVNIPVL